MRLTLRTLLAYVDDILEPAQAREIGAKIAEHPDAAKLMKRIREVLRRRRVGSPALAGPGSGPDPNVVAEYLDNTLPPQLVQELERLCLESDIHLAEVAGSHKILSLVLSEPVDVPADVRDRMYVLGNVAKPAPVKLPDKSMDEPAVAASRENAATHFELQQRLFSSIEVGEMTDGIPEYLKPRSTWKRWAGIAGICALVIGWICLVFFDPRIWPGANAEGTKVTGEDQKLVADTGQRPRAEPPANAKKAVAGAQQSANAEKGGASASAPLPAEKPGKPTATTTVESPTAVAETENLPEPVQDQVAGEDTSVKQNTGAEQGTAAAESATPPAAPMPTEAAAAEEQKESAEGEAVAVASKPEPAPPQAPPAAPPAQAMYTNAEGILLVQTPMQQGWMVSPRRAILHEGESLAVPEPYTADLLFSDSQRNETILQMGIQSSTRLSLIAPEGGGAVGIELHRGRVKVWCPSTSEGPVQLLVRVGGRDWQVELTEPGTVCGIAVEPPQPAGPPGEMGPMLFGGGVLVATGGIKMGIAGGPQLDFRAGTGMIPWARDGEPLIPQLPSGIPDWLTPDGVITTPSAKLYARTFEKEFALDRPAVDSIAPVTRDRQAKISELAVRTVGLLGDYKDLATALHSEHEEARLAAIEWLREWLPQSPENADLLRQELAHYFQEEQIPVILRLLWGFSVQDAHDPKVSQQLVEWMGDDDITIRELAFYHVYRLTGRREGYRPNLPLSFRQAAVVRWEEYVKRNGALLSD